MNKIKIVIIAECGPGVDRMVKGRNIVDEITYNSIVALKDIGAKVLSAEVAHEDHDIHTLLV